MTDHDSQRRRAVKGCLSLTNGTSISANFYERRLLVHFIQGALTIDQVCALLDERASCAIYPPFSKGRV